jgi:hypothetical protein
LSRVYEIARRGTRLYDGTVEAGVRIVRRSDFDGPVTTDEEPEPGYPPTDADGCFYSVEYTLPTSSGASGPVFGSVEDAVQHAEKVLQSPVVWNLA